MSYWRKYWFGKFCLSSLNTAITTSAYTHCAHTTLSSWHSRYVLALTLRFELTLTQRTGLRRYISINAWATRSLTIGTCQLTLELCTQSQIPQMEWQSNRRASIVRWHYQLSTFLWLLCFRPFLFLSKKSFFFLCFFLFVFWETKKSYVFYAFWIILRKVVRMDRRPATNGQNH